MKVIVLGAAAGGGFPQWNANSSMNRRAFAGDRNTPRLTQCSLAVSADGGDWLLLNASPDIRQQVVATPELHPRSGVRSSPIRSVILTGADVDALAGLLTLRERQHFTVWASDYVLAAVEANPIFGVLDRAVVRFERIGNHGRFEPLAGLVCEIFAAPGKPPLYLERAHGISAKEGASFGLRITDGASKVLVFLPACAEITPEIVRSVNDADALFFDGTMYKDDEMIQSGEGNKTARRMGHVSMSGDAGSIALLLEARSRQRYFIHINNSNPVLDRESPERKAVEDAGWKIAEDGMRLEL